MSGQLMPRRGSRTSRSSATPAASAVQSFGYEARRGALLSLDENKSIPWQLRPRLQGGSAHILTTIPVPQRNAALIGPPSSPPPCSARHAKPKRDYLRGLLASFSPSEEHGRPTGCLPQCSGDHGPINSNSPCDLAGLVSFDTLTAFTTRRMQMGRKQGLNPRDIHARSWPAHRGSPALSISLTTDDITSFEFQTSVAWPGMAALTAIRPSPPPPLNRIPRRRHHMFSRRSCADPSDWCAPRR